MTTWLLAFVLIASHAVFAAPAPEIAGKTSYASSSVAAAMHTHCAQHAAPAPASDHSRHGPGAPCCHDKSCTCAQACVTPTLATTIAMPLAPARIFAMTSSRTCAAIESPLLRPPIA